MPKHRSTVYTVVREHREYPNYDRRTFWAFDYVMGTYLTVERADEVAGAHLQAFRDAGMNDDHYRFTVHASTWYEE